METSIEYNGFVIEPATRRRGTPPAWTLEVHITPAGRRLHHHRQADLARLRRERGIALVGTLVPGHAGHT